MSNLNRDQIIKDYKQKKEDILIQSNLLLRDLAYRRAMEKSKLKNKRGAFSNQGSSQDLDFFLDSSFNAEQESILNDQKKDIKNLREDTVNKSKTKSRKTPKNKEDFLMEYLKGFSNIF